MYLTRQLMFAKVFDDEINAFRAHADYVASLSKRERATRSVTYGYCGSEHGYVITVEFHKSGRVAFIAH